MNVLDVDMYMRVCIYVRNMSIYLCTQIYGIETSRYIDLSILMHICLHRILIITWIFFLSHSPALLHTHTHTHTTHIYIYIHTHINTHTHIHTHIYIYIHVCIYKCVSIYIYIYIHAYVYTSEWVHIYIYIHAYV